MTPASSPTTFAFCLEALLAAPAVRTARPVISTRCRAMSSASTYLELDDGRPDD